mgnify:FL=1
MRKILFAIVQLLTISSAAIQAQTTLDPAKVQEVTDLRLRSQALERMTENIRGPKTWETLHYKR